MVLRLLDSTGLSTLSFIGKLVNELSKALPIFRASMRSTMYKLGGERRDAVS